MFDRILTSIDLDDEKIAARLMSVALEMADKHQCELHVITVIPSYSMAIVGSYFPPDHERKMVEAVEHRLSEFLARQGGDTKTEVHGHVAHGTIYDQIMDTAERLDCDLIVMGAHRPELRDYLLGPNAARVVRHARQSVFVVRDRA